MKDVRKADEKVDELAGNSVEGMVVELVVKAADRLGGALAAWKVFEQARELAAPLERNIFDMKVYKSVDYLALIAERESAALKAD